MVIGSSAAFGAVVESCQIYFVDFWAAAKALVQEVNVSEGFVLPAAARAEFYRESASACFHPPHDQQMTVAVRC